MFEFFLENHNIPHICHQVLIHLEFNELMVCMKVSKLWRDLILDFLQNTSNGAKKHLNYSWATSHLEVQHRGHLEEGYNNYAKLIKTSQGLFLSEEIKLVSNKNKKENPSKAQGS